MIITRALLTETALAAEFVASLAARRLPEKFFYWFPLSVRAWLYLCSDGEYRNFVRSRSLIARTGDAVAALAGPGRLEVLSLGSGQGDKDVILLEALRRAGAEVRYLPVDCSQALLEMACGGAIESGFAAEGVKADFTDPSHLAALRGSGVRRLVMMIGNTLGSLDPLAGASGIAALLAPGDLLLIDGEISAAETMAGYDNPLNRRFAWAPLHSVGIGEADGEIAFEMAEDSRLPGLHLIRKHFRAARPASALVGGERLAVEAGERVEMSHSYKYSQDAFVAVLRGAGLRVEWQATSDDGRFLMALAGLG